MQMSNVIKPQNKTNNYTEAYIKLGNEIQINALYNDRC